jgi:enoyl-CoA hydratase/carnithine racemase
MTYETLLLEQEQAVAWLTFNRPDVGNDERGMFSESPMPGWHSTARPTCAIVLTGSGRRSTPDST